MIFKSRASIPSGGITYIVAGLGNPDRKYENTRHNAGFMGIDALAKKHDVEIDRLKFKSYCSSIEIDGKRVLLMKPQTYMNESGKAVVEAMNFYKIRPQNVVIIYDDISLDVGLMRIKRKGSDGGQKGMRSIIYLSGSDEFPRVKIGIGEKPPRMDLADYVLGHFSSEDKKIIEESADRVSEAIPLLVHDMCDEAMNKING